MQEARDEVFCHLVARRAVARAALHLGCSAMTEESLDVLADVLLEYMQRIGKTVAYSVESSGRSSAHVNILDTIHAVELCTLPAVQRVHVDVQAETSATVTPSTTTTATTDPRQQMSWKGLAAFLFGPDWHVAPGQTASSLDDTEGGVATTDRYGGKVGPSAAMTTTDNADDTATTIQKGWDAPYPEEIPPFPIASSRVANPHTLTNTAAVETLHTTIDTGSKDSNEYTAQDEQVDIPDSVFAKGWGAFDRTTVEETAMQVEDTGKRKRTDSDVQQPPSKKARVSFADAALDTSHEAGDKTDGDLSLSYLPCFYPPLPRASESLRRSVLDIEQSLPPPPRQTDASGGTSVTDTTLVRTTADDPNKTVRSALVQLGQQYYWGSGWDDFDKPTLAVPPGTTPAAPTQVQPEIVPLARASGSRVSRILEGSMDAAAL